MLDLPAPSPSTASTDDLVSALANTRASLQAWSARIHNPQSPHLVAIPDLRASAEVLLADAVLGLLEQDEREALLESIRAEQQDSGEWLDAQGQADLSLTVLCAWALRARGSSQDQKAIELARSGVLDRGGAQRGSFSLRLWLAMAGAIPWDFVPAVPSELWLLPAKLPISAHGLSARAQSYLTAFHLMASAKTRVHIGDISDFIERNEESKAIAPRLTRPGFVGDLMQSLDRAIKLSRKLPRRPIRKASLRRAQRLLCDQQQAHGGWFSVRPTLWAMMALRAHGRQSDDPVLLRGVAYIRRCRGWVERDGKKYLVQGHSARPMAQEIELARAQQDKRLRSLILDNEIRQSGPWQRRAECPPGGWPTEALATLHFDLWASVEALEGLYHLHRQDPGDLKISNARRRAAQLLLAMQEIDGSFALFERGETQVAIAKAPWLDAEPLRSWPPPSSFHVVLSARALGALHGLGWRPHDDRIQRGLAYISQAFKDNENVWPVEHLAPILRALSPMLSPEDPLRQGLERRLRSRQREDGSFGSLHATAHALHALISLCPSKDLPVCAQSQRAARCLIQEIVENPQALQSPSPPVPGCALARWAVDPSAPAKAAHFALLALDAAQS